MSTTYTLTVPDIEFLEFNRIADFNALNLPSASRATSNCQNYIRFYNINMVLNQFVHSGIDINWAIPTTLGASAPASGTLVLTVNKLDSIFAQYTTGDFTVVTGTPADLSKYTIQQIQQAGYVIKALVETVLANTYSELRPVVGATSAAVPEVQYGVVVAAPTNKSITITVS